MKVITVISQKGGAGKTTLAIHLAAAGAGAGLTALILDTDPQATASHWSEWRGSSDLEVVDCASPPLLPRKLQQAAELVDADTPMGARALEIYKTFVEEEDGKGRDFSAMLPRLAGRGRSD